MKGILNATCDESECNSARNKDDCVHASEEVVRSLASFVPASFPLAKLSVVVHRQSSFLSILWSRRSYLLLCATTSCLPVFIDLLQPKCQLSHLHH